MVCDEEGGEDPGSSLEPERREREKQALPVHRKASLCPQSRTFSDNPVRAPENQKKEKADPSCQEQSVN